MSAPQTPATRRSSRNHPQRRHQHQTRLFHAFIHTARHRSNSGCIDASGREIELWQATERHLGKYLKVTSKTASLADLSTVSQHADASLLSRVTAIGTEACAGNIAGVLAAKKNGQAAHLLRRAKTSTGFGGNKVLLRLFVGDALSLRAQGNLLLHQFSENPARANRCRLRRSLHFPAQPPSSGPKCRAWPLYKRTCWLRRSAREPKRY